MIGEVIEFPADEDGTAAGNFQFTDSDASSVLF
jgi:hypothetical protein